MEYLSYENDKHAAIIQKAFFGYTTRKMLTQIKDQYNSIFEQIEGPNSDLAVYWPSNSTTHDTEEWDIDKKFFICKPQILRREEIKKIKEKNEQLIKEKEENMIKIMKTENTERLESPNFIKPIETKSKFGSTCKYIALF